MSLDNRGEAAQCAVHDGVGIFGIERLAHARRADDIGKQHCDVLESLRVAAILFFDFGELFAQRRQRGIDHRVTEHGALRFECGDRPLDLFAFVHARASASLTTLAGRACHAATMSR